MVLERMLKIPNLVLSGNNKKPKASIYSFSIKTKNGKFLH